MNLLWDSCQGGTKSDSVAEDVKVPPFKVNSEYPSFGAWQGLPKSSGPIPYSGNGLWPVLQRSRLGGRMGEQELAL